MKILFRKRTGNPSLGIGFFWTLTIDAKSPTLITDFLIPELFFDYFFIKKGKVTSVDKMQSSERLLPQQVFKTIHTYPLTLVLSAPLVLFGVRFSLRFAELFWGDVLQSNSLLEQRWVDQNTDDLVSFESQITDYIQEHPVRKTPYPLLSSAFKESNWLVNFSERHKRRLYKTVFGVNRKELQNIRNIHLFLGQTCDFFSQNPRIVQHVNPGVYCDQPHLNRAFKKLTGFSPVEYFEANSILQDNLMSASYNEVSDL
jgi:AraC-like DNA-binding protein